MPSSQSYCYISDSGGQFLLPQFQNIEMHHRDRLISALLQDRGALRLISAPHGFGKSLLAYEYAQRLFSSGKIVWMDASTPDFLRCLDDGTLLPRDSSEPYPDLIIIDSVPFLDEQRASTLAEHIDVFLFRGVETIVTVVPSNDCLRSTQPDRVLITAFDLLVSEKECENKELESNTLLTSISSELWHHQKSMLFGLTPCAIWGNLEKASELCLMGFFRENLPLELRRSVFCMLLMGEGSLHDIERIGLNVRHESEVILARDYPFIEIDPIQRTFSTSSFDLQVLNSVVEKSGLVDAFISGSMPLPEKVIGLLLERGSVDRASLILENFCSDTRCAVWLRERGWYLLDAGELSLVETLLDRCPTHILENDRILMSLRAWASGLVGDVHEATHYAQSVLRGVEDSDKPTPRESDGAAAMSYLALLAFADGGGAIYKKRPFGNGQSAFPEDFLADVIDLCDEVELARALCLRSGDRERLLQAQRITPEESRVHAIETLFTCSADRFAQTPFYRLALHFLQYVDNLELHKLLQNLGCGVVVAARRHGLSCTTEALLVDDLWRNGFFGVSGRGGDVRDARLLDSAAYIFSRMGIMASGQPLLVPWESGMLQDAAMGDTRRRVALVSDDTPKTDQIAIAHTRLFGGFEVTLGDRLINESTWRRKSRLLFVLLVLGQGRDVTREFIFSQLWPGTNRERALDNFYSVWSNAEKTLGGAPYIERNGEFCRINHRYVNSDVAEFEQLVRRLLTERDDTAVLLDIFARLETIYRGPLLPSELTNPHILAQRSRLSSMYTDAMVSATNHALKANDARIALWFARRAIEEDAHREDVFLALMRAQIAAGQRCSAIRTFFKCQEYLRDELGLDPSFEIKELYSKLIASDPSLIKLEPSSFKR